MSKRQYSRRQKSATFDDDSEEEDEMESAKTIAKLQSILLQQKKQISELELKYDDTNNTLPKSITTTGKTIAISTVSTSNSNFFPKKLNHGQKMSLNVFISQMIFPEVKFFSKETSIRYPKLTEACIRHVMPRASTYDVLTYRLDTEKYIRGKFNDMRSYMKKQILAKFKGTMPMHDRASTYQNKNTNDQTLFSHRVRYSYHKRANRRIQNGNL